MAEKSTVTKKGSKITETWEDGSSVTYTDPNYNPEPNWGPPKAKSAPAKKASKPKVKPTKAPVVTPKGTQTGHAVTNSQNYTRPVN